MSKPNIRDCLCHFPPDCPNCVNEPPRTLVNIIDETRTRWATEIKECQDALLDTPKAKPNILDRLVVEFDYLLIEARNAIRKAS